MTWKLIFSRIVSLSSLFCHFNCSLGDYLLCPDYQAVCLHGDRSPRERSQALADFKVRHLSFHEKFFADGVNGYYKSSDTPSQFVQVQLWIYDFEVYKESFIWKFKWGVSKDGKIPTHFPVFRRKQIYHETVIYNITDHIQAKKKPFLVCTDVAARGIDIGGVPFCKWFCSFLC